MPKARANGLEIEYESFGPAQGPAILFIMGLGAQLTLWPDALMQGLAAAGFRAIRFDNRDIGLSSKFDKAGIPDIRQAFADAMAGKPVQAPYTLEDMAADAIGLLDALAIQRAHVVGASMGGMIAQLIAAKYPERTKSLVSIMSTSGSPEVPPGKPEAMQALMSVPENPLDRESVIRHGMKVRRIIGSPGYAPSDEELHALVTRNYDRSFYPVGGARQFAAILASGSRLELLPKIKAPTLVVHGADDPLVPLEGGRDTAKRIPGAELRIIPGMGHDFAPGLVPIHLDAILQHCRRVEAG